MKLKQWVNVEKSRSTNSGCEPMQQQIFRFGVLFERWMRGQHEMVPHPFDWTSKCDAALKEIPNVKRVSC
jgi:hypothetical protein